MTMRLIDQQANWIDQYQPGLRIEEQGVVVSVGDGIVWVAGLPSAAMDEVLVFSDGSLAMVFDLTEGRIGAILLHDTEKLTAGTTVQRAKHPLSVPVGDSLLGRTLDPMGTVLDGGEPLTGTVWQALESSSPAIIARDFVHKPLYMGSKIIDTMIPVGMGQRQLIIGDDGLGRSAIAIDAVINQRDQNVYCIYVLIGQKRSAIVNTIHILQEHGAMDYTTVVVAEASCLPGLQHLAPFAGCAIAEFWMRQGWDVLVVYDDLSSHAKTYRELSLLLRRPPGREAFPGDIFSIHAGLLERATCLNAANGGGSITALPIVETNLGEIAAYIPTNLISITDGQIYLDRTLFTGGFRPAIDIALSVSRIGGQAQHPNIKEEAGRMKLDYLQFLELEVFSRFGARLEASMEASIQRGRLLREILKQDRLSPLPAKFQLAWMVAFNDGHFDGKTLDDVPQLLSLLQKSLADSHLSLDSHREQWSGAVSDWFSEMPGADLS